jgi:hypothetical protein
MTQHTANFSMKVALFVRWLIAGIFALLLAVPVVISFVNNT